MLNLSSRNLLRSNSPLFHIVLGCGWGVVLGIACLLLSGKLVLGALGALIFLYALIKRPEIGLIGILIATASVVFEDRLPLIPLGGFSLHIPDVLLLTSLGLIILRWMGERNFKLVRTPLDWPLLAFVGITLLSTIVAILGSSVDPILSRRAIRTLLYYLTFFIVTNLVRERRQLIFLVNGILLLATVVAAMMVAQYIVGNSIAIIPGRVEELQTEGVAYQDITRILPPGQSVVMVAFVALFCLLILQEFKPAGIMWLLTQIGLLGAAILVTFLRSYWATIAIVILLMIFIFRGQERQKYIIWVSVILISLAVLLILVYNLPNSEGAKLAGAATERIGTLFRAETFQGEDKSFTWRKIEMQYALPQILSHPLLGMGMGANYRPWDSRIDIPGDQSGRSYLHNGHLLLLIQSGLLGYLSFIWLSFSFLARGYKHWKAVNDQRMKGVVLGFSAIFLAAFLAAGVNSTFMQWYWTPLLGILMGINEVIFLNFRQVNDHK